MFPVSDIGITEKDPNRLYYAYDGINLSYATVDERSGLVLCVDFIPGNLPSLRISVADGVQGWFDGVSERFFGFYDEDAVADLRDAVAKYGVTLKPEVAEALDLMGEDA